ncbi:MAG: hypothetical protein HW387_528 [Parachlamydiales bacterium]|nr:hypothetical protein [Parachlamydiales bacterium]
MNSLPAVALDAPTTELSTCAAPEKITNQSPQRERTINLTSLALDAIMPELSSGAAPEKKTSRLPLSLRMIKYLTGASAIAAVATIIYGLATNILAFMVIGGIFAAATLSSFYLIRRSAQLKGIEDNTMELNELNASLTAKDAQIEQLIGQLQELNKKLREQENKVSQVLQNDQERQQQSNERLHESVDTLAKLQAGAQIAQDQAANELAEQIAAMQKQSEKDQQLIIKLNATVKEAREQINSLEKALADLQKQIAESPKQKKEKAEFGAGISQQIKTITETLKTTTDTVSSDRARAVELDKQIALQTDRVDKTSKTIENIDALLNAIYERLPKS